MLIEGSLTWCGQEYETQGDQKPPKKLPEHWKEINTFSNNEGTLLNGKIWASETMANMN